MTYAEVTPESRILPFFFNEKNSGTTPESQRGPCPQKTEKPRALRILVVDDEGLIADSVAEILSENGYEAHAAYSGKSAIESAHERCPDILMSDVLMPHVNGVETAKAIQAICPKVRILLFSGQAGTIDLLQQARSEGYDFELLSKPIHPDQLLKRLS
ncbi:MAG: response regulator receiver protein [Candidatus Angelobacter sp.]|nr:response regulator receiver protein [Candidatus Angelobacter sp.]